MRSRSCVGLVVLVWASLAMVSRAHAQSPVTSAASLSADLRSVAKLSLSPVSATFADADPDVVAQIPSLGGALTITAKARATSGSQVLLTVQASDDLRSGLSVIPASAITWTASGAGFAPGALSKSAPVVVARWSGSGVRSGTQTLYFANVWSYATGTYSTTLVYTLTAP
jgi:hypothetical protein